MTTTLTEPFPPHCLRPGIFRHYAPPVESVDLDGEELVWHTISSSFYDPDGTIGGRLLRWVDNQGEVGYEVRIDGMEDSSGICDLAAYSIDMINAVAWVANNLRYEWQEIIDQQWYYPFTSRWPNERYPDA